MLGFVILIGIVVNNAILLVEQALNLMEPWRLGEIAAGEKPMGSREAIAESVRTRIRPIFMSSMTSVVGTLPLVAYPGSGSEMYRGIGAVLIGGQLVSTIFTLLLVPLVFSLLIDMRDGARRLMGWTVGGRAGGLDALLLAERERTAAGGPVAGAPVSYGQATPAATTPKTP
jgi:HAE1 family hydrophobic/amphiphilic exporter-1